MKNLILCLIFIAVIFPSAYNTCRHFDFSHSEDTKSYVKMAKGDYQVNVTHKYRFLIPVLCYYSTKVISALIPKKAFEIDANLWHIQLSFLMWNMLFLMLSCLIMFKWLSLFNFSFLACLLGVLLFATSRWVNYSAGLPMIDSLYYFTVFLLLYGISSNQLYTIVLALILGLIAKESFIIFLPLIFFSKDWKVLILYAIVALCVFYCTRLYIDFTFPYSATNGVENALNHFQTIKFSLKRIFSIKGVMELWMVFGWFNLLIFILLIYHLNKKIKIFTSIQYLFIFFLGIIFIHMLLSGDTDRMFSLSAPFFGYLLAQLFTQYEFSKTNLIV